MTFDISAFVSPGATPAPRRASPRPAVPLSGPGPIPGGSRVIARVLWALRLAERSRGPGASLSAGAIAEAATIAGWPTAHNNVSRAVLEDGRDLPALSEVTAADGSVIPARDAVPGRRWVERTPGGEIRLTDAGRAVALGLD